MLKNCLFHKVKKQEPELKTNNIHDLGLKGQVPQNYLCTSVLNFYEQDKTSFVLS